MTYSVGARLGPYEIVSLIGKGGMGEVYNARDNRLGRNVAIKVSQDQFSERFEREARAVAALNHPNICQLFDVGPNYLVMEFVDGPMLSERLHRGPLTVEESIPIARQIAEAVEFAHEKGIIHRDLKPENIKITADGAVKVLDFGLAKAAETIADPGAAPTVKAATLGGVIMGTPGYMSPEQARGVAVDKRSDIWSYGVILYEMSTGRRLFEGETVSDTLVAVLTKEPELEAVPLRLRRLVSRCLTKDVKRRLRDIGEARLMLEAPEEPSSAAPAPAVVPRRPYWPLASIALFGVAAILAVLLWLASRPLEQPLVRITEDLGSDFELLNSARGSNLAISPDGNRIAFVSRDGPEGRIYTRRLDQGSLHALAGTEGSASPFFSSDNQWIGFFADGKLKKVPAEGGSPITLCDAPNPRGATWGDDGNIVVALTNPGPLSRVPAAGGVPTPVTTQEAPDRTHRFPHLLPGSKAVLYVNMQRADADNAEIHVLNLATGKSKKLIQPGTFPRYSRSGHLLFQSHGTIYAVSFDPRTLETKGSPSPVLESVYWLYTNGATSFDISQTRTVVYREDVPPPPRTLHWLDSSGQQTSALAKPMRILNMRLSPDGTRVALIVWNSGSTDLWTYDIEKKTLLRLTSGAYAQNPVWTPDGAHLVYTGPAGIHWRRSDGTDEPRLLLPRSGLQAPEAFSPDGKLLVTTYSTREVHTVRIGGSAGSPVAASPEPFMKEMPSQTSAELSPDGKLIAYSAFLDEKPEVFVTAFPGKATRWQVSAGGGVNPHWSSNGREILFGTLQGEIKAASYSMQGERFVAGPPRLWSAFRTPSYSRMFSPDNYFSISPDGKRLLVHASESNQTPPAPSKVTFLLHFFDEIKRRMPQGAGE